MVMLPVQATLCFFCFVYLLIVSRGWQWKYDMCYIHIGVLLYRWWVYFLAALTLLWSPWRMFQCLRNACDWDDWGVRYCCRCAAFYVHACGEASRTYLWLQNNSPGTTKEPRYYMPHALYKPNLLHNITHDERLYSSHNRADPHHQMSRVRSFCWWILNVRLPRGTIGIVIVNPMPPLWFVRVRLLFERARDVTTHAATADTRCVLLLYSVESNFRDTSH